MIYRRNPAFTQKYFVAGANCTPEMAILSLRKEERLLKETREHHRANGLRLQAKRIKAEKKLKKAIQNDDEVTALMARADLIEVAHAEKDAAEAWVDLEEEILDLEGAIRELTEQRLFPGIPEREAFKRALPVEWMHRSARRAENYIIQQMTGIPHDQVDAIRMQPGSRQIFEHIEKLTGVKLHNTLTASVGAGSSELPGGHVNILEGGSDDGR